MANKFIDQNGLRYFYTKIKRMLEGKVEKESLDKSLSSASSDANAPSSKCVYDAIQKVFGGKTVVFSDTPPAAGTSDDIITFVKRSG